MKKLYEYILSGIKSSQVFYDSKLQETFDNYLVSLQYSVRQLRSSYRSNLVVVDYSRPSIQAAYLIAYYPHYAEMTLEILRLLLSDLKCDREVKACFFGAGPCPEIVGLAQFLVERSPKTRKLIANVYDIASETWTISREITQNSIVPKLWRGKLALNGDRIDFSQRNAFKKIQSIVQASNIFIFQNCFNEIKNPSTLLKNIDFLLDNAPIGSFIIIADLFHSQNVVLFKEIEKRIDRRDDLEILKEGTLRVTSSLPIPQILRKSLLTGEDGLIPRFRINFQFFALRKGDRIRYDYDEIPF